MVDLDHHLAQHKIIQWWERFSDASSNQNNHTLEQRLQGHTTESPLQKQTQGIWLKADILATKPLAHLREGQIVLKTPSHPLHLTRTHVELAARKERKKNWKIATTDFLGLTLGKQ